DLGPVDALEAADPGAAVLLVGVEAAAAGLQAAGRVDHPLARDGALAARPGGEPGRGGGGGGHGRSLVSTGLLNPPARSLARAPARGAQARQRSPNRVLSSATRPLSRGSTVNCSPRRRRRRRSPVSTSTTTGTGPRWST